MLTLTIYNQATMYSKDNVPISTIHLILHLLLCRLREVIWLQLLKYWQCCSLNRVRVCSRATQRTGLCLIVLCLTSRTFAFICALSHKSYICVLTLVSPCPCWPINQLEKKRPKLGQHFWIWDILSTMCALYKSFSHIHTQVYLLSMRVSHACKLFVSVNSVLLKENVSPP